MDSEYRDYKFQLLNFAKDVLWEDYSNSRQEADQNFDIQRDAWREHRQGAMPVYTKPKLPTPEQIINMAETFQKFIEKKK